jgi:hypothetical protein
MVKEKLIIAIDFDGTCVTHEYPNVGKDIGAVPVLKKLVDAGHVLMLWTMRGTKPVYDRDTLLEAVQWFEKNGIPLWGINQNPEQHASQWTNSHKQYAHLYIDDAALGCPLKYDYIVSHEGNSSELEPIGRPYVDWMEVEHMLTKQGII